MSNESIDKLFLSIKNDCLKLITLKRVDLQDLSFKMGFSLDDLVGYILKRSSDFSIYMKMYELLLEW